jgi:EamA domain-containing membrane protein RarD
VVAVTEPTPLDKAEQAVREATQNTTDVVQIAAAVLATQQAQQQPACVAQQATQQRPLGLYVAAGIGGAVALSFLAMAAALLAVAVAVGAVCATVCLLVLRSVWQDMHKDR